jgi:hypothetical protein
MFLYKDMLASIADNDGLFVTVEVKGKTPSAFICMKMLKFAVGSTDQDK